MAEFGLATGQQVGQHFPDRITGRRATGNEVVNFDHFMQRVHLVERQGQLRVIRNQAITQTGAGVINLFQNGAERQVIALRRQTTIDGAGADGDQDFAVFAEIAQHMHVFSVAQTAFDDANVALRVDLFNVGQRRTVKFNVFKQREQPLN